MGANAQTSVPAFVSGQVLTAQQQTEINTGVPVFATTTTRDAAFGGTGEKVLAEGQLAYIEASNVVQYYDGSTWATLAPTTSAVAQVKSTAKTDAFTSTSTSLTDITGLSVSITPTSATNKVLVIAVINASYSTNNTVGLYFTLVRGSTAIGVGDAAGSRSQTTTDLIAQAANTSVIGATTIAFLDSPATTSATTYKVQARSQTANTFAVNRTVLDTDNANYQRTISTITVFEVTP